MALPAVCVLVVGCTGSESSPRTSVTQVPSPTSTSSTIRPTTSTVTFPTLTFAEQEEPSVFTEFTHSSACDPDAAEANLQVIQAFVTAYNERDQTRLAELLASNPPIADMSGIPHLGRDHWTAVSTWSEMGWRVDDRLQLSRLIMYDSGSVFDLVRSNDVLRANGIETLRHSGKVHSFRCSISHLVLYLPRSEEPTSPECLFWEVFEDALAEGTTQSISEPEACLG